MSYIFSFVFEYIVNIYSEMVELILTDTFGQDSRAPRTVSLTISMLTAN